MAELDEIASLVIQKSLSGKIEWFYDGSNLLTTKMGKNIIELKKASNALATQFTLFIRDEDGVVLSSATYSGASGFSNVFEKLRREHLGVDEALESITSSLKKL